MREIAASPATTQRSLVQRLGAGLDRINFCLRVLTSKDRVNASKFRRNNNWGYVGVLTPQQGVEENLRLPLRHLQCKTVAYYGLRLEALRREAEPVAHPGPDQQQRATPPPL